MHLHKSPTRCKCYKSTRVLEKMFGWGQLADLTIKCLQWHIVSKFYVYFLYIESESVLGEQIKSKRAMVSGIYPSPLFALPHALTTHLPIEADVYFRGIKY